MTSNEEKLELIKAVREEIRLICNKYGNSLITGDAAMYWAYNDLQKSITHLNEAEQIIEGLKRAQEKLEVKLND
jgi:hypothetical protein